MALKDWVSGRAATATPATPATHGRGNRGTVATVATVAVAGIPKTEGIADKEAREERAAIFEYDAGMTRAEAEQLAGIAGDGFVAPALETLSANITQAAA